MKTGSTKPRNIIHFKPFTFNRAAMQLCRKGVCVPVSALPLRILDLLLSASNQVVSRQVLKTALWPNSDAIDTEKRLNTAMRALREALGDSAENPRYIQTVRGLGYRWVVQQPAGLWSRKAGWAMAAASLAVAGWLAVTALDIWSGGASPEPAATVQKIKVLVRNDTDPEALSRLLDQMIREAGTQDNVRIQTRVAPAGE